jgi:hypothetical protein
LGGIPTDPGISMAGAPADTIERCAAVKQAIGGEDGKTTLQLADLNLGDHRR